VLCSEDFNFVARLQPYLPEGRSATFLDAGANIGMASLLFSLILPLPLSITAIEPHPDTYSILVQNAAASEQLVVTTTPVHAALVTHERALSNPEAELSGAVSVFVSFAVKEIYDKKAPMKSNCVVPTTSLPIVLVSPTLPSIPCCLCIAEMLARMCFRTCTGQLILVLAIVLSVGMQHRLCIILQHTQSSLSALEPCFAVRQALPMYADSIRSGCFRFHQAGHRRRRDSYSAGVCITHSAVSSTVHLCGAPRKTNAWG
jgi:FkbM family methyltransferase